MTTQDIPVWAVLHVRPRCEKKLADYCEHHGMRHYLPLRRETKIFQRRKVTVFKPLFPGYLFLQYALERKADVLKSNQVVRIIDVSDQDKLVHELDQIRMALEIDPTLGTVEHFTPGKPVRVKSGPFQGLEGVVATIRGQARILLNVEMIGQSVALEVEAAMLESN